MRVASFSLSVRSQCLEHPLRQVGAYRADSMLRQQVSPPCRNPTGFRERRNREQPAYDGIGALRSAFPEHWLGFAGSRLSHTMIMWNSTGTCRRCGAAIALHPRRIRRAIGAVSGYFRRS